MKISLEIKRYLIFLNFTFFKLLYKPPLQTKTSIKAFLCQRAGKFRFYLNFHLFSDEFILEPQNILLNRIQLLQLQLLSNFLSANLLGPPPEFFNIFHPEERISIFELTQFQLAVIIICSLVILL